MYKTRIFFVVFCVFLTEKVSSLTCFDCGPTDSNRCENTTNVKQTLCGSNKVEQSPLKRKISDIGRNNIEPRNNGTKQFQCFSMYFDSKDTNETKTGVYRDCQELSSDILENDVCEFLKEELDFGNITSCSSCSQDLCNVHQLGGGGSKKAPDSVSISALLLLNCFTFLWHFKEHIN